MGDGSNHVALTLVLTPTATARPRLGQAQQAAAIEATALKWVVLFKIRACDNKYVIFETSQMAAI